MTYELIILPTAEKHIQYLKKKEIQAYKKLLKLLSELREHPEKGTGHPKPLGGNRTGQWSRRITDKHRLVYQIKEEQITVLVLTAYGHYDDK